MLGGKALGDGSTVWDSKPHPEAPSAIWGSRKGPLPTNEWWVNLVLEDGGKLGENVITSLPYLIKALDDGLHAGLPGPKVTTSGYVSRRNVVSVAP